MLKHLPRIPLLLSVVFLATIALTGCSASRKAANTGKQPSQIASSDRELRKKYAARLSASSGDIDNLPLYRFVEEWYGVPYRYGGNGKSGVDCSGFSAKLYATVYDVPIQRTAQLQFNTCKKVRKRKLREGDLVFFDEGGKKITHVGVYLINEYFVHASTGNGVVISNLRDSYWDRHFAGGGRLR